MFHGPKDCLVNIRNSRAPNYSQGRCDVTVTQVTRVFTTGPPDVTWQRSWTLLHARGGKQCWPCVESPVDWLAVSVGILT